MALASAATGVMSSVIEKLVTLLGEEYKKHKRMQQGVGFLKDELSSMNAVLNKLAKMEGELDPQTMEWSNQVKDMAFDMEDYIDDFMHQVNGSANSCDAGFVGKIAQYINALRAHYHFANQIQQLKIQVNDVGERRKRYKLDECTSSSINVAVDPRVPALYIEAASLVGMEGPKEEVNKLLLEDDGASVHRLKFVSIVGFGGLGKTTLANQIYHEIGGQYKCKVFVSVSQRPDMMKLLRRIITKVGMEEPTYTYEIHDLIDKIREYLTDKRFLFVIDDIWDESLWGVIRCAFPENLKGSKVITTTRVETVANASCNYRHEFVYKMRPLDYQNSRKLFFSRVGHVLTQPCEEIFDEILKKCGGLPLAIISIASLLASQPTRPIEQWKYVCSSLSSDMTLEGMRQVLRLSYNDLPFHLKTCMLYIAMYPEDYYIRKENLVMQWIAEGLVGKIHGREEEEIAESYFNELVNRSMIQPTRIKPNGQVLICKVHDMILDLIRLKSEEEKFMSVVDNVPSMNTALESKVRRLSLQLDYRGTGRTSTPRISMSHIRSIALFGNYPSELPICELKSIRVLNLDCQAVDKAETIDLTPINKLVQLRYLSIMFSRKGYVTCGSAQLPTTIGNLQRLETLMLHTYTIAMPSDIFDLPCLKHLHVPIGARLPDGICRMKFLRTLEYFDVHMNSLHNLKGLGELSNLRVLSFCWDYVDHSISQNGIIDIFLSSVAKLICCNLRSLHSGSRIFSPPAVELGSLSTGDTESNLEELYTLPNWMFSRVPSWTGQHRKLYRLAITVEKLMQEDIDLLAGLTNLVYLWLWIRKTPEERIIIRNGAVEFQVLECFSISCFAPRIIFMAGAMPKLKILDLDIHERGVKRHGASTLEGVEHLPSLGEVELYFNFEKADTEVDRRAANAEAILRDSISMHPGHPRIKIRPLNSARWGPDKFHDLCSDEEATG